MQKPRLVRDFVEYRVECNEELRRKLEELQEIGKDDIEDDICPKLGEYLKNQRNMDKRRSSYLMGCHYVNTLYTDDDGVYLTLDSDDNDDPELVRLLIEGLKDVCNTPVRLVKTSTKYRMLGLRRDDSTALMDEARKRGWLGHENKKYIHFHLRSLLPGDAELYWSHYDGLNVVVTFNEGKDTPDNLYKAEKLLIRAFTEQYLERW